MIRFLELLIALLIVATLFVVVGLFLPSERYVTHSLETNRPIRTVYDTLNSFRRFNDWHPLRARDPRIRYQLEGPVSGVGARLAYASTNPQIGSGTLEIIESVEDELVVIEAKNDSYGESKIHTFVLDNKGKTIEIDWSYDVNYGWSLLGHYAGLYVNRTVGDDIKIGLGNLIGLLATMPNFDYRALEISTTPVQPVNQLFTSLTTDRNITAVDNGMMKGVSDLRSAIAANKLEEAGPVRLITTNFSGDKYEFDVAIPVRKAGGDTAAADAGIPAFSEEVDSPETTMPVADAAATEIMPAPEPIEGLTLPENVQQGASYGGHALMAAYQGHPASLPLVRDMLRAYAAAHGDVIHDRAFEEYLSPHDLPEPDKSEFHVYWPIKSIGTPTQDGAL